MGEHALTMREPPSLVALAHSSLLVNAVRMIFVNFIRFAKIMEPALSILSTVFQLQDANVTEILLEQSVTWSPVIFLVIIEEYVMVTLVNAAERMELQSIMVKIVKCLVVMHAMEVRVRMEVPVRQLTKVKLRPVS